MPIHRFIREAAFDQTAIAILVRAYEAALQCLPLAHRSPTMRERLARKIIEIARYGEEDPLTIRDRALSELGLPAGK
jgi:hypothetical protein